MRTMCVSLWYQKNNNMTQDQFNQLWEKGQQVSVSLDADYPTANFQKFPEDVTAELQGEFCGVHFAFDSLSEFYADWTTCMFSLDTVGDLDRRKNSHGEHVYLMKMRSNANYGVLEVENGAEYRAKTWMCEIRKIQA